MASTGLDAATVVGIACGVRTAGCRATGALVGGEGAASANGCSGCIGGAGIAGGLMVGGFIVTRADGCSGSDGTLVGAVASVGGARSRPSGVPELATDEDD